MRFKNRVAIISGAGAGMGKATALAFAQEGAFVVINDVNEESLSNTADEIRSIGGTATAIKGDATKTECANAVAGKALDLYEKIDILFNYVGGSPDGAPMTLFTEQTEAYWDRTIELNLKSTIIFSRAVLDSMIKQRCGKIINLAAAAGRVGGESMAIYSAAKGGVIAFTKALAKEVARHGINVNCVSPGAIDTPGRTRVRPAEVTKSVMDSIPLKRVGRSQEIASAVLFMASDEASYITGQVLSVDGGMTMI